MKNKTIILIGNFIVILGIFFSFKILSFASSALFQAIPSNATVQLDQTKIDWWLVRAKNHQTPGFNDQLKFNLADYKGICLGDTSRKVIYLTFDEGYENGYTNQILDVLKAHQVKGMFFVTLPYIQQNDALIKRMHKEGHLVCNHSNHHLSMPSLVNDSEKFTKELSDVSTAYTQLTGQNMPPFFRPPMGHYSEKSLSLTKELGYQTVFWSFAYCDWKPEAQPDPSSAKRLMLDGLHNGAIYLLHAVSKTNANVDRKSVV